MTARRKGGVKTPPDLATIVGWLKEEAPGRSVKADRLASTVAMLKNGPLDWERIDQANRDQMAERNKVRSEIFDAASTLRRYLAAAGNGDFPIIPNVNAIADLAANLVPEINRLIGFTDCKPERATPAWHSWAWLFSSDVIQAWEDGGSDFFRGNLPRFGKTEESPLVRVVQKLLAEAGKDVELRTVSAVLLANPDPGPAVPENTTESAPGFDSYVAGQWEWDARGRRKKTASTAPDQNLPENTKKKKRGRPRTRDIGPQTE